MKVAWPHGHRFAFTVFDDTDWATLESVKPVYDLLEVLGMRTTKSVWVLPGNGTQMNGGATCEDRDYLEWVLTLQRRGFEIGLHNAAPSTSTREQTRQALDRFRELFGDQQLAHCNHFGCLENIYWGKARLSGWRRVAMGLVARGRFRISRGHVVGDPLFWGDLCRARVRYVRNLVFRDLNTLAVCPEMPYHDPTKPYVNFWFAAANGSGPRRFLENFTWARVDRLIEEGGLCIAYVHFGASGFVTNGAVNDVFRNRMEYIASQNGWFAPVSEVLDYLRQGQDPSERTISPQSLRRLELKWLAGKVLEGSS